MSVDEEIGELETLMASAPHEINISFLDHRGRKTTKLVGNTSEKNFVKGQNRTYEFEFKEPQFVSLIQIDTRDYADGNKASFTCTYHPSGDKGKVQVANANNAWVVQINGFITKFSIEPPRKYLGDQLLTSVQIKGFSSSEFSDIAKQVGSVENLRQSALEKCKERLETVTAKEAEVEGLNQKIAELTETINRLDGEKAQVESQIDSAQEKLEATGRAVGSKKQELSEYSARIESASSSIEQKTEERKQLSTEIAKADAELRELKENINMFPTEISGFVSQGASSIRRYSFLAAIPIIVIGLVTVDLFSKASELSHLENLPEAVSIWEILIARFPYVLVCGALIASSYKLARVFIAEIIRINEQRLNLTKISIIAKDVSDASEDGLSLDDAARYEHRTHLKMDLLRAHLKGYLADGYQYSKKELPTQDLLPEDVGNESEG
ncbi:hypothetical protein [Alcanivorax sp.]|uniref:hypothetical protein n=1 Tax=Alcanivorax sp. TaxID=1872427 RepID=UPI0025BEB604|nr:hypothetical protein [Alcanivorax sp.]